MLSEEKVKELAEKMPRGFLWSEGCEWESGVLIQEATEFARAIEAAVLAEQAKDDPVAAQVRFRHPQKSMPDWSIWQSAKINKDHKSYEIDSQGYEVEYRLLYLHPAPASEGMVMVPREPTDAMYAAVDNERLAQAYWRKLIAAAEKEAVKCSQ